MSLIFVIIEWKVQVTEYGGEGWSEDWVGTEDKRGGQCAGISWLDQTNRSVTVYWDTCISWVCPYTLLSTRCVADATGRKQPVWRRIYTRFRLCSFVISFSLLFPLFFLACLLLLLLFTLPNELFQAHKPICLQALEELPSHKAQWLISAKSAIGFCCGICQDTGGRLPVPQDRTPCSLVLMPLICVHVQHRERWDTGP